MKTLIIASLILLSSCISGTVIDKTFSESKTIYVAPYITQHYEIVRIVEKYEKPNEWILTIQTKNGIRKIIVPLEVGDTIQVNDVYPKK